MKNLRQFSFFLIIMTTICLSNSHAQYWDPDVRRSYLNPEARARYDNTLNATLKKKKDIINNSEYVVLMDGVKYIDVEKYEEYALGIANIVKIYKGSSYVELGENYIIGYDDLYPGGPFKRLSIRG